MKALLFMLASMGLNAPSDIDVVAMGSEAGGGLVGGITLLPDELSYACSIDIRTKDNSEEALTYRATFELNRSNMKIQLDQLQFSGLLDVPISGAITAEYLVRDFSLLDADTVKLNIAITPNQTHGSNNVIAFSGTSETLATQKILVLGGDLFLGSLDNANPDTVWSEFKQARVNVQCTQDN